MQDDLSRGFYRFMEFSMTARKLREKRGKMGRNTK